MTTTRPVVNFSVPTENTGNFGLENSTQVGSNYVYSSLSCENCETGNTSWNGVAIMMVGIIFLALALLLFARKYIFKLHETSRN